MARAIAIYEMKGLTMMTATSASTLAKSKRVLLNEINSALHAGGETQFASGHFDAFLRVAAADTAIENDLAWLIMQYRKAGMTDL